MQVTPSCSLFCRPQVLDLGICTKLTAAVHAFAHELGRTKTLEHGTAGQMLRIANKRFLFACRTHCVPSIFPGYVFARHDRCTVSTVSNMVKMTLQCRQMMVRNVIPTLHCNACRC